ncbi:MAG: hypothetical protein ACOYH4_03010 [Saccharofermentanales bacterium]|jgi:hypothetical protein
MKKSLMIVITLLCCVFFIGTTVVAAVGTYNAVGEARQRDEMERLRQAGVEIEDKFLEEDPGEMTDDMFKDADILFKANADTFNLQDFEPIEVNDVDATNGTGSKILLDKIMTYQEYCDQYDDTCTLTDVDPMRMVRVVRVFHPGEYDTLRGGIYKDATATGLYDAETGFYFGGFVQGEQITEGGYAAHRR